MCLKQGSNTTAWPQQTRPRTRGAEPALRGLGEVVRGRRREDAFGGVGARLGGRRQGRVCHKKGFQAAGGSLGRSVLPITGSHEGLAGSRISFM